MKTRNKIIIAGIGIGVAASLFKKALRPLGSYIVGGGIIAYELGCELAEVTGDALAHAARRIRPTTSSDSSEETQRSSR